MDLCHFRKGFRKGVWFSKTRVPFRVPLYESAVLYWGPNLENHPYDVFKLKGSRIQGPQVFKLLRYRL